MKKEKKDKDFVKSPYFEGGRAAMDAYVRKELRYPKDALAHKVEGRVSIQYTIDYKGKVIEAHVISGIGHGCDEEALRIVRNLPFKVPEQGKIKSKYSRKLHIHFRLPGSGMKKENAQTKPLSNSQIQPIHQGVQINYQITPSKTRETLAKPVKSTSIQYNFSIPVNKPKK
jgi:TonB family protein